MNVVPTIADNTLGVIYERGLIGIYHEWCEGFSTYSRTYDLIHAQVQGQVRFFLFHPQVIIVIIGNLKL